MKTASWGKFSFLLDAFFERVAFEVLHNEVEIALLRHVEIHDVADIGVINGSSGPRFAFETLDHFAVFANIAVQNLDGYDFLHPYVLSLKDLAHRTSTHGLYEAIFPIDRIKKLLTHTHHT